MLILIIWVICGIIVNILFAESIGILFFKYFKVVGPLLILIHFLFGPLLLLIDVYDRWLS
jgi:hypothetical protein